MLAFSTTGYIAFFVLILFVCLYSSVLRRWFPVLLIILGAWILFLTFGESITRLPRQGLVWDVLQVRFLDRLHFDDFDQVYIEFIRNHPSYLLLGTGFGNFHLASFEEASKILTSFEFGIILPKLGVFKVMATTGLVGLGSFLYLSIDLLAKLRRIFTSLSNSIECKFVFDVYRLLLFLVVVAVFLRFTTLGLLWVGVGYALIEVATKTLHPFQDDILNDSSKVLA